MRDLHLAPAARVAKLEGDGSPAHRRALAVAYAAIEGPEFPEELEHLYRWSLELAGRSGGGMDGLAPLTYTAIRDWAMLTHRTPSALEVDALLKLDAAMRARPDDTPAED